MRHNLAMLIAGIIGAGAAVAATPSINYQGRITAGGASFSGAGYFKFVLTNGGGGLWSNDGTPGAGEPAGALSVQVNNGIFSVALGTDTPQPLDPLMFHAGALWLRTWFSTNSAGPFEQLVPDTEIRTIDFAQIDTGNLLVVDDDGTADFDNVQDGINFLSDNPWAAGLLVMPGYYQLTSPLTFPTSNRWEYLIRGWGDRQAIEISNPNGPAAQLQGARIENITLSGNPAVTDLGNQDGYWFEARRCTFRHTGEAGPAAALGTSGGGEFMECRFENNDGGEALLTSGDAWADATHCSFWAGGGSSSVITLRDLHGSVALDSCRADPWDAPASITIERGNGSLTCYDGRFAGPLVVSNSDARATHDGCSIGGVLGYGSTGSLDFRECDLGTGGRSCVDLEDCSGHYWFRNCTMVSGGQPAFVAKDTTGEVWVKDCEIHGWDAAAVEIAASAALPPDQWVGIKLHRCRILSFSSDGSVSNCSAIEARNAPENPGRRIGVGVDVAWSEVSGTVRDGIECTGGWVQIFSAALSGERNALTIVDGGAQVTGGSRAQGSDCGIFSSGSSVMVDDAEIIGNNRAGILSSNSSVSVVSSSVRAAAGDGVNSTLDDASISSSRVNGSRHGIAVADGEMDITSGTYAEGGECGVSSANSEILVIGSHVEGSIDGVRLQGGSAYVERSSLSGGSSDDGEQPGDGLHADGDLGELAIVAIGSQIDGSGPSSSPVGRGIYMASTGVTSLITGSTLHGNTGLECIGGRHWLSDSTLVTLPGEGGPCARFVNGATKVTMEKCSLLLEDPSATNAVVLLFGTGANTDTPAPQLISSTLRSASSGPSFAVDIGGTLITGRVSMVNCCLSTNLSPSVENVAPAAMDARGNYIIPLPR